jgi:PBP4 family serine-type D-alanyl-D-alanine carboxypeptidase
MLSKTNGREVKGAGTTVSGTRVGASELTSAGVPAIQYKLVDGSGLSRYNRLAPATLVTLERYAAKKGWGRYLDLSLPIAGVNGTLSDRMRGTAAARVCHAKTGTLSDVSALSGYVTAKSGTRFAFSVVTNGADVTRSRALQDRIAIFLATWTGR